MDYKQMILDNKFSLLAALPANNLDLAKAALDGGADAVKVHCNVWHRASGNTFGTFAENREFIRKLIELCGDVPVGLVPGTAEAFITPEERVELEEMGLAFISSYAHNLPCHMLESKKLVKMVAIDCDDMDRSLDAVRMSPDIDILEASIQPGENYGKDMTLTDILRYADVAAKSGKPCAVPTQKFVRPEEVKYLYQAGCKAIMIGAIVMGKNPTPEQVRATTRAFRNAVDAL